MKKVSDVFKNIRYTADEPQVMQEDLRNWFNPNHPEGDWKRVNSKGEVVGDCAREPGEPKPKCMSKELRNSLSKKEKASAVRRKRKEDPNPERQGAPINVTNKVNEDMEQLDEKNKPTNPELWSRAIAQAKSKFDVYPSAYANGWASKWYKSKGGSWKTVSEAKEKSEYDYEGDMARGQLQSIINNAQRVHDMLEDNDNLPEWVQSKITLAEDYISTVANYMMSEVDEEVVVEQGKGLWANIRAKRERIKNGSGERMRKPGSEGAPSEEILKKTQAVKEEMSNDDKSSVALRALVAKKNLKQSDGKVKSVDFLAKMKNRVKAGENLKKEEVELEEGRQSQRHPLEGHEYHKKSDEALVHIAKDAHAAAEAMKSHNTTAENKYRDQANDSATVRHYRKTHGMADWYKKKYGHIKEEVVEEGAKSPGVGWMLKADPKLGEKVKANKEKYKEFKQNVGKKTTPMKEEVVDEEVKDEYARKVDKYLKKKYGKDDSQKKLPQGASFAAARRKARLASNGRMDEALSPAIRMQMALQKAKEDRERSERNGEAALAGKFSSGPAKQPMKNPSLVSPKNEEVIVEDNVINKVPKPPFDEPTRKARGTVKDKSGAEHTSMSRVKDLAKRAARKQAGIKEAADINDPLDKIDTSAKRSLSRTAGMVKDLATNAKAKAKSKDKKDTFEAEPEISSQIMKQD